MKKFMSVLLVITIMASMTIPTIAAMPEEVSPLYDYTSWASIALTITEDGKTYISIDCNGESDCTDIRARTFLSRLVDGEWVPVDIGLTPNYWYDEIQGRVLIKTYTFQLEEKGTYRADVEFTVYGVGGTYPDEVLTFYDTRTYR